MSRTCGCKHSPRGHDVKDCPVLQTPMAEANRSKFCQQCGSRLIILILKKTYDAMDGSLIEFKNLRCRKFSIWNPFTWRHDIDVF